VVLVGGAGSVGGVAAGSGLIGGLETVLSYQIPATVAQALVLILAVVILRFRPRGIIPA
jgi:branched-chain amino acid transport system permease protein/urea transport system permease protein